MLSDSTMCIMCGKADQASNGIVELIDGVEYLFDKKECATMFKKLKSVYGAEFCVNLTA